MKTRFPTTFTLRHTDSSPALEAEIEQCALRLDKLGTRATRCSVLVEAPAHHHRHGAAWHVRVELSLPGHEVIVDRESEPDAFEAVRRAFEITSRRVGSWRARARTKARGA